MTDEGLTLTRIDTHNRAAPAAPFLLIDADSAIFKAGMSNETRMYEVMDEDFNLLFEAPYKKEVDAWVEAEGDGTEIITKTRTAGPVHFSLANVKSIMEMILTQFPNSDYQVYIDGDGNFRDEVWDQYKENRKGGPRPIHEEDIREYLIKYWDAALVHDEETDDRVSWAQCAATDPDDTCIVSPDKDLLNTPGWLFNYMSCTLRYITEEEADLNFARQLLTGDATDNIPGLPKVGAKTAEKILPAYTPNWKQVVFDEYKNRLGLDDEKIRELIQRNGTLLWMRREPNQMWEF